MRAYAEAIDSTLPCEPWIRRVAGRPGTSPWWPREPDRASARSVAGVGAADGLYRADRGSGGPASLFVAAVGNGLAPRAVEGWAEKLSKKWVGGAGTLPGRWLGRG
jgi:hypothetical protein